MSSLTILWNGYRKSIQVSDNAIMSKVLSDACRIHGIENADGFYLRYKKVAIDMSQPFRFTGIPRNTTLELRKVEIVSTNSSVRVCLKLPSGERLQGIYPSSFSLLRILTDSFAKHNICATPSTLSASTVVFMRCSYTGDVLSSTTLSSIGLNGGSAMFNVCNFEQGNNIDVADITAAKQPQNELPSDQAEYDSSVVSSAGNLPTYFNLPMPTVQHSQLSEVTKIACEDETHPVSNADSLVDSSQVVQDECALPEDEFKHVELGIALCEGALELMFNEHFEEDLSICIQTLAKYIDGVLKFPGRQQTRTIHLSNQAYFQKVGRFQGGELFLQGIGFVCKTLDGGLSHEIACDPSKYNILVLLPERENRGLLLEARDLIVKAALKLANPPRIPEVPSQVEEPTQFTLGFDPYKSMVTSTIPQPKGSEESITFKRLSQLKAKQSCIEESESLSVALRNIRVSYGPKRKLATNENDDMDVDNKSDNTILAQQVARQMAERKKLESVPFRTRAMRELEKFEKTKAYSYAVVKVIFPDRSEMKAKFRPLEKVSSVFEAVKLCLHSKISETCSFDLYISPPRCVLKPDMSLSDQGLVPAAVIYLSWHPETAEMLTAMGLGQVFGDFFNAEVECDSDASLQYPSGTPLSSSSLPGNDRKNLAETSEKKKGKPGWLKL